MSDYAATELVRPLLALLTERAPATSVVFDPLPLEHDQLASYLERRDFLVGGARRLLRRD